MCLWITECSVVCSVFGFNACSRATPFIPSCSAKCSFLQSQSSGSAPLHNMLCFYVFNSLIFRSLVVAGAVMRIEFCDSALYSRMNTSASLSSGAMAMLNFSCTGCAQLSVKTVYSHPLKKILTSALSLVKIKIPRDKTLITLFVNICQYHLNFCMLLCYLRHRVESSWGWTPAFSWSGSVRCHGDSRGSSHPWQRWRQRSGRRRAQRGPELVLPRQKSSQAGWEHAQR